MPARIGELREAQDRPLVRRLRRDRDGRLRPQQGALSGKTIYLSPGHGWAVSSSVGWTTARGNSHGVVEDLGNADGVQQFLVPYLLRAGAQVVGVKELDPTTEMVIVDNDDGLSHPARGRYVESGDAQAFIDSTLDAFGYPALPMTSGTNPFRLGSNRLMLSAPTETARATFVLNVPKDGHYNVYVAYSMYKMRAPDARYTVVHAGGKAIFEVDQRRHGRTWVLLGRFYFVAGADESRGALIVSNRSAEPGTNVSVDAVRIGGGMGLISRGGKTSGQPRADECCRYHAQFAGAPADVYDPSSGSDMVDGISCRSRFADWLHAPGEPAAYLSFHSNAFNGSLRGSETYIYGNNPPNGSFEPSPSVVTLGADSLAQAVHSQMVGSVRKRYEPGWNDRKVKSAYFGELSPKHQDEMPSALIEVAFHDQPEDARALRDGEFRRLVARAVGKGVIDHFTGAAGAYPPEAPAAVVARGSGDSVTISWGAPASGGALGSPATSYRVYRSADGRAFDDGSDTAGQLSLTISGLAPGAVVYLRVAAVNAAGESAPSTTLAVGLPPSGGAGRPLLLVAGFDRLDEPLAIQRQYGGSLGQVARILVDQMNARSYLVEHAEALTPLAVAFDAATHQAIEEQLVVPSSYWMLLWQGGKGLSGGKVLTSTVAAAIQQAWAAGSSVIFSGSQLTSGLSGSHSTAPEQALLADVLQAELIAPNEQGQVLPAADGVLAGISPWEIASAAQQPYDGLATEVVGAIGEGRIVASYPGGGGAAVLRVTSSKQCSLLLAFPFETVLPAARRSQLLQQLLSVCQPGDAPPPADAGPVDAGLPADLGQVDAGPADSAVDGWAGHDGGREKPPGFNADTGGCGLFRQQGTAASSGGASLGGLLVALLALAAIGRRRRSC